ncbi:beta-1,6-N-acetylglucosaminyltransferase [Chitinophaga japonensis]|uniref:Peptide O-xylosyltransferase n=1 Tax=Chitinophaga japonensis TaxID=104662 RepID=A0A562SXX1_CHIJA|nr:beta-1,6-N-acetylglucosaminyltransferase [Chitinophaga japonensis]TWI86207.1 core-2/I-Branching enzyme [Chitinophaga japonensis]
MKKIAFIILAHKHPVQLHRLLQRLAHPGIDCYVHVDAKCDLAAWQQALALPQVYTVQQRVKVTWAGWSILQATLNGMQAVLDSGEDYAYVTLLSAQDYLLKPAAFIYDYLCARENSGRQFLNVISDAALAPMMSKMNHYHFVEYNFPGKYKFGNLLTAVMPKRRPPLGYKLYCGSAWWTLTPDCVAYCLQFERQHPALRRYFRFTWGSDEFLLQTILMNSHYREQVTMDNLHYIDWAEGLEHPKTFGPEDLQTLLQSGKLFARKFDMGKVEVMDKIDQYKWEKYEV